MALFLGPVCHLWTQFLLHGVLGGFLTFQASRLRFRFDDKSLDLVFIEPFGPDSAALSANAGSSGDNKLQGGGENKWSLKSVTNWEFWWPGFPVLVYFKETQTRPEGAWVALLGAAAPAAAHPPLHPAPVPCRSAVCTGASMTGAFAAFPSLYTQASRTSSQSSSTGRGSTWRCWREAHRTRAAHAALCCWRIARQVLPGT